MNNEKYENNLAPSLDFLTNSHARTEVNGSLEFYARTRVAGGMYG